MMDIGKIPQKYGKILQTYTFDEKNYIKKIEVAYTIVSDELDPSFITSSTGIYPNDSWCKGDSEIKINKRTGQKGIAKRLNGIWRMNTNGKVNSPYINDHIHVLLSLVEPAKTFFKKLCLQEGYRVFFHVYRECFDVQGFFCISSDNMLRMADLCQEIEFLCPVELTEDVEDDSENNDA